MCPTQPDPRAANIGVCRLLAELHIWALPSPLQTVALLCEGHSSMIITHWGQLGTLEVS
jgi:hypothetical protein